MGTSNGFTFQSPSSSRATSKRFRTWTDSLRISALRVHDIVVKDEKGSLTDRDLDADGAIKLSMGKKKHVLLKPKA